MLFFSKIEEIRGYYIKQFILETERYILQVLSYIWKPKIKLIHILHKK